MWREELPKSPTSEIPGEGFLFCVDRRGLMLAFCSKTSSVSGSFRHKNIMMGKHSSPWRRNFNDCTRAKTARPDKLLETLS
jgi:hypothetical protein